MSLLNLSQIQQQMTESDVFGGSISTSTGKQVLVNGAKAKNVKALKENLWQGPEVKSFRESFQRKFGFDWADSKKFPVGDDRWSWNKVANRLGHGTVGSALREADSATTFTQVLRAGIQNLVNVCPLME